MVWFILIPFTIKEIIAKRDYIKKNFLVINIDIPTFTSTFIHYLENKFEAFQGFQVNEELVSNANDNYLFMHCLPAHRGEEVTDGVIDSKNSIVFDQAENRMWAQMSLLTYMCNPIAWEAYRDLY